MKNDKHATYWLSKKHMTLTLVFMEVHERLYFDEILYTINIYIHTYISALHKIKILTMNVT